MLAMQAGAGREDQSELAATSALLAFYHFVILSTPIPRRQRIALIEVSSGNLDRAAQFLIAPIMAVLLRFVDCPPGYCLSFRAR